MTIRRKYYYEQYELPFNPNSEPVKVEGNTLVFLVQDESPFDPFEEFDMGEFYQFNPRNNHGVERPSIEDFKRLVRANPGRVFTVDCYGDRYGIGPRVTVADCRNKRGQYSTAERLLDDADGYYIVPDDVPEDSREQYARGELATYNAYCEGDVWGICRWTYDDNGTLTDRDEVWGYYEREYAESEV